EDVSTVRLQRFPYPSYIEETDVSNYALVLSRFSIGMLVPFAVFATRLTDEKTSGMKEMLRIIGVSDWVYWASHYLSAFFMHLITVTLMMIFLCIKRNDEGRSFIQRSDPFLVFCVLLNFCSSCMLHAALLSLFFANREFTTDHAQIFDSRKFGKVNYCHGYHFITRGHKLWTCIFPGMNLHWGFRVLNRFEKFVDSGANWSNFYDPKETPDNVTLFEIATVGFLSDVLIIVLVWYLDNVLPIGPGISKPVGYPFMKSYWFPGMTSLKAVDKTDEEKLNFETEPKNQVVAIELLQVNKVSKKIIPQNYKDTVAVSNCNMRVFEGQITVLLGHNGAGKTTTLNMITGYIDATSGTILVGGYDILNATRDARKSVGYCAQHNILYRDLTVEEHLLFFAAVKGAPRDRLRLELVTLLGEVGLMEVRNTLAALLSPGFQRRLCMALAIIATPKLVVLDEPTANMDPDARREMWELLLKVRRQSAVLITTQHMDEADVLGDRIAIMANGRIRCMGSPAFLKQRFGTGYHMQVNKAAFCNVSAIESLLRKYAPRARLQSDSDNEAVFVLGQIVTTRHTIAMFRDLEQGKDKLGIESLGLTVTTLEDVLMRVGEEHHFRRHHMHSDFDDENEFIEARGKSLFNVMADNISSEPGLVQRIRALLAKRAICTWRQWRLPLFSWLLPPLLLFSLFYLEEVENKHLKKRVFGIRYFNKPLILLYILQRNFGFNKIPPNGPRHSVYLPHYFLLCAHVHKRFLGRFNLEAKLDAVTLLIQSAPHRVLENSTKTQSAFVEKYLGPVLVEQSFKTDDIPADYNIAQYLLGIAQHSLRHYIFDIHAGFQMTKQKGWVSARQSTEGALPLIERSNAVKHLHFMNGVSCLLYWSANFFWDFMFYLGTALLVLPPLLSQLDYLVGIDTQAIILLNLLHGFAVLPGIYITSFFFDNPIQGYSTLAITAFILSFLGCLGTVFVEHFAYTINAPLVMVVLEVMLQAMLLVPSFSYSRGMTKILELSSENKICRTGGVNLERVCHTHAIDFKLSLKLCCEGERSRSRNPPFLDGVKVKDAAHTRFVQPSFKHLHRLQVMLEDSDAVRENALVDTLSGSVGRDARPFGPDQRPAMVVSRLTKAYGWWQKKPVLQGLSFVLRTGECFGLLGVNGAGKTTTFRILTGDVLPADGDVFLDGFSIVRQTKLVQAHLGYCPQRDGLVDELTGTETLILHSRLKGVANDADYLEVLFEIFDLADIAGNLVGTYSAGNKRKLSLCLAMVGMPR
ncbi:ABC transporter, putative, partial [Ixodes scapularis]